MELTWWQVGVLPLVGVGGGGGPRRAAAVGASAG